MSPGDPAFRAPSTFERWFNKGMGALVGLGLGPRDYYLLRVRGRTTGREYSTPVNVAELEGRRFLVAPRGRTQWVRNAEVAGEVTLAQGRVVRRFRLRAVPDGEKPPVLRAYLDRFRLTVQRYFPLRAGSPPEAFAGIAGRYPVFEMMPSNDRERGRGEGAR